MSASGCCCGSRGPRLAAPFAVSRLDGARRWAPVTAPILALLSVLALRALVIFSAQT